LKLFAIAKRINFARLKWTAKTAWLIFSLGVGIWFAFSLWSAFKSHDPEKLGCTASFGAANNIFSYVQLELLDQHPAEPYFNGGLFLNLGGAYGKQPTSVAFTLSGTRVYAQSMVNVDLHYDEAAQTLWMSKSADIVLYRPSGAHRDFPFDSAKFDFDLSYSPTVPINNFLIRNRNPSFDIPCDTYRVERKNANTVHLSFEARRNPLVQLTAVVLVGAGLLFLVGIIGFVKRESLPASIASFFFSLWSIRAILSSEMKTFPTVLDLAILSLCVLLLVALGVRLGLENPNMRNRLAS
jgi:hypothetical protein